MMDEEKPGSTRIVTILPEGIVVKKGDVVCQLDSSAFEDELKAQLIRFAQSQAWVQQAQAIFEVNEITLREYRDGIYPQDLQLIRQYIQTCQIERDRAARNLEWSRNMAKKGFRTQAQLTADMLADQQTGIALSEANGMLVRLEQFTGPKIIKSLEAKLQAIRSDKSSQEKSFALDPSTRPASEKHQELHAPRPRETASSSTSTRPMAGDAWNRRSSKALPFDRTSRSSSFPIPRICTSRPGSTRPRWLT